MATISVLDLSGHMQAQFCADGDLEVCEAKSAVNFTVRGEQAECHLRIDPGDAESLGGLLGRRNEPPKSPHGVDGFKPIGGFAMVGRFKLYAGAAGRVQIHMYDGEIEAILTLDAAETHKLAVKLSGVAWRVRSGLNGRAA